MYDGDIARPSLIASNCAQFLLTGNDGTELHAPPMRQFGDRRAVHHGTSGSRPWRCLYLLKGFQMAGHMTRRSENNQSHILKQKHENVNTKLKATTAGDFSAQAKTTDFNHVGNVTAAIWVGCCGDEYNCFLV